MRNKGALGCAALLGAAIAFPAGLMLGGGGAGRQPAEPETAEGSRVAGKRAVRDYYGPSVLDDPYVVEQQLRVVEALELSCRELGEHCVEARRARERVDENARR